MVIFIPVSEKTSITKGSQFTVLLKIVILCYCEHTTTMVTTFSIQSLMGAIRKFTKKISFFCFKLVCSTLGQLKARLRCLEVLCMFVTGSFFLCPIGYQHRASLQVSTNRHLNPEHNILCVLIAWRTFLGIWYTFQMLSVSKPFWINSYLTVYFSTRYGSHKFPILN